MQKLILLIVMALSQVGVVGAEEEKGPRKFEELAVKGKVYKGVTIREVTPAGIKIFHEAGATTIPYEHLTLKLQRELGGFDPELAKKHREGKTKVKKVEEKKEVAEASERKEERKADEKRG